MNTTLLSPADSYISKRSTPSSQAIDRSALNAAARALDCASYTDCDWVLENRQAALIRAAVNALSPGWAKVVWSAVRQVTMTARSMRLIDSDTAVSILELPAPRGSGGHRGRTPDDSEVGRLLDVAAQDPTLCGQRDSAVIAVSAGGGLRAAETRLHVGNGELPQAEKACCVCGYTYIRDRPLNLSERRARNRIHTVCTE